MAARTECEEVLKEGGCWKVKRTVGREEETNQKEKLFEV
jgi:hypothetical protein